MTRRNMLQSALAGAAIPRAVGDPARRIFERVNELRVASGVGALVWSDVLGVCARQQSDRRNELRFPAHVDPERGDVAARLDAAGVKWSHCGENLFREIGYDDPVHYAVVCWWYSAGHKQNMLNPVFTETAVGVTRGADGTYFATQIFVAPR